MDKISPQKCFVDTSWLTPEKALNVKISITRLDVFNIQFLKEKCHCHHIYNLNTPDAKKTTPTSKKKETLLES